MSKYRITADVEGETPILGGDALDVTGRLWHGTITSVEALLTDAEKLERAVGFIRDLAMGTAAPRYCDEYGREYIRELAKERCIDLGDDGGDSVKDTRTVIGDKTWVRCPHCPSSVAPEWRIMHLKEEHGDDQA